MGLLKNTFSILTRTFEANSIYSGFRLMWAPVNVGSRIMWTFYQGRILYCVYYITSDNLGSCLMWTKRAGPMPTLSGIHCIYKSSRIQTSIHVSYCTEKNTLSQSSGARRCSIPLHLSSLFLRRAGVRCVPCIVQESLVQGPYVTFSSQFL